MSLDPFFTAAVKHDPWEIREREHRARRRIAQRRARKRISEGMRLARDGKHGKGKSERP